MHSGQPPASDNSRRARAYWRANLRLIGVLLAVWAVVSCGLGILAAGWLNQFSIGQLPLGFWIAQQGSIYVFLLLVLIYAWQMQRLDKRFGVNE
jgi:putative solute:sodium symporter small subunit